MEIWLASSNTGKIRELTALLDGLNCSVHHQNELDFYSPPPETGSSFLENAKIKAKSLASIKKNVWVLADDSGLECEGLGNLPGIHSARYAGENARDSENTAKLLKMLQIRTNNRKAAFKCVVAAIDPTGQEHIYEGELKGLIATKASGSSGFGYDPVFVPDGFDKTMAELSPAEKNKISHRAIALKKFKEYLQASL